MPRPISHPYSSTSASGLNAAARPANCTACPGNAARSRCMPGKYSVPCVPWETMWIASTGGPDCTDCAICPSALPRRSNTTTSTPDAAWPTICSQPGNLGSTNNSSRRCGAVPSAMPGSMPGPLTACARSAAGAAVSGTAWGARSSATNAAPSNRVRDSNAIKLLRARKRELRAGIGTPGMLPESKRGKGQSWQNPGLLGLWAAEEASAAKRPRRSILHRLLAPWLRRLLPPRLLAHIALPQV